MEPGITSSNLLGFINLKDPPFNAVGDGAAADRRALAEADAAGRSSLVYIPPGTYRIESDMTFSAPLLLAPGARLRPDPGFRVTIAGPILASPLQTIFDCTRNVFGVRRTTATTVDGNREITVNDPAGITTGQRIWVLTAANRRGDLKTTVTGVSGRRVTLQTAPGTALDGVSNAPAPIIHESSDPGSWVVMESRFLITSKQQVSPVWFTGTASTTGTSGSRLNTLTVTSTAGLHEGKQITIAGAGRGGAALTTSIRRLDGLELTLADATAVAVTDAAVTFTDFGAQWNNMQAAIKWGEAGPMSVRIAGQHVYTIPIDMTNIRMAGGEKVSLHCEDSLLIAQTSGQPAIDLMKARGIRFYNLNLRGDTNTSAQTAYSPHIGILMGRDVGEDSAGDMEFYSSMVTGFFSLAAVYANESEVNAMFGGRYGNDHRTGKYIVWVGNENNEGIVGPYCGALGVTSSATTWHVYGVTIRGNGASEGLLYNAGFDRLIIHGGYFRSEGVSPAIVIDTSLGAQAGFQCIDSHFEPGLSVVPAMGLKGAFNNGIANLYFRPLLFTSNNPGVIVDVASRLNLKSCIFEGITGALRFDRGSVLEECKIDMRGGVSAERLPESLVLGDKFTGQIGMGTIGSFTTTGSIAAGASSLTVASASKIVEGQAITVAGAGGGRVGSRDCGHE
jgi:hypothetical protein